MNGMTANHEFERLVVDWLDEAAGSAAPDYLGETLSRIEGVRQRPAWMSPGRWLPMRALTLRRFEVPRFVPYLVALGLLLVLAIAVAILVGSQRRLPPPFGLAATGLFVYDSGGDIYVADPDGTAAQPIQATPAVEFGAAWAPNGTRFAYWSQGNASSEVDLWIRSSDLRSPRLVIGDLPITAAREFHSVTWAPDSSRLAFATADGELYVATADGQGVQRIGGDFEPGFFEPAWSPLGDLIAFRGGGRLTYSGPAPADSDLGVYVIRPDGTGVERVSESRGGLNTHLRPSWSPDGSSLLYHSTDLGVTQNQDIMIARRNATGWTEATLVAGPNIDSWPAWSNDGLRISFLRSDVEDHGRIVVADRDGSNPHRLDTPLIGWAPHCWTPDDKAILAIGAEPDRSFLDIDPPRFLLLRLDDPSKPTLIPAAGLASFGACSWQRVAP